MTQVTIKFRTVEELAFASDVTRCNMRTRYHRDGAFDAVPDLLHAIDVFLDELESCHNLADTLTREILAHGPTNAALVGYEAERRPATTDLVMLNRRNGPEQVMQLVEERAPDGYKVVTDVLSLKELEDIAANYKRVAGFQVEALNAKPPIVQAPKARAS